MTNKRRPDDTGPENAAMPTDEPGAQIDAQFLDIAGGDRGLAKLLQSSLERLRDGVAGEDLQEMARDVLAGRTRLRDVATSDAYGDMVLDHFHRFARWQQELAPEERRQHINDAIIHAQQIGGT